MPDRLTLTNGARADDTLAGGQCRRGGGHGELCADTTLTCHTA